MSHSCGHAKAGIRNRMDAVGGRVEVGRRCGSDDGGGRDAMLEEIRGAVR